MKHGIDISAYQGIIDWQKAKSAWVDFAFIRQRSCGVLNRLFVARDMNFITNWDASRLAGIPRGAYTLIDYSGKGMAISAQANAVVSDFKLMGRYQYDGEKPLVLDLERKYMSWPEYPVRTKLLAIMRIWMETVSAWSGMAVALYCNQATWKYLEPIPAWLGEHPVWIAWPMKKSPPSEIPYTWWQYSWKGDGKKYGCSSKSVDLNWEVE
jgi:lysozyme